jgi:hypothetical protein
MGEVWPWLRAKVVSLRGLLGSVLGVVCLVGYIYDVDEGAIIGPIVRYPTPLGLVALLCLIGHLLVEWKLHRQSQQTQAEHYDVQWSNIIWRCEILDDVLQGDPKALCGICMAELDWDSASQPVPDKNTVRYTAHCPNLECDRALTVDGPNDSSRVEYVRTFVQGRIRRDLWRSKQEAAERDAAAEQYDGFDI